MAKYIDVEKVFCADCEDRDRCGSPDVFCDVHSMPAADVAPVVHGRWVDKMVRDWHCSECGKKVPRQVHFDGYCYDDKLNFCPNCGADMRERKGDDAAD